MLHLTARAPYGRPLSDHAVSRDLWGRLRTSFPTALACCFMGNHLHLLVDDDPQRARRAVTRMLAQRGWWKVAVSLVSPDHVKVRRQLRYIALNPCRARLVPDPLAWLWSTHRDLVGATVDPWVPAARLARYGTARELHRYISADPSVALEGTPFPATQPPPWLHGLGDIARAAIVSTRSVEADLRRRSPCRTAFLQLARAEGWHRPELLASVAHTHVRTVYRAWDRPAIHGPARLCLHDERLLEAR